MNFREDAGIVTVLYTLQRPAGGQFATRVVEALNTTITSVSASIVVEGISRFGM